MKLLAAPGQVLNYSNEGYCLLGGVIEGAAGAPYAQHVERAVVAPLGMTRTTIGAAHLQAFANVASHLQREGDAWIDAGVWDAPLFYPAGGVITSARDLVRLISVLDDGHSLLAPKSREQLQRCRIGVASRPDPGIGYGLGLEHNRIGADFTLLWHSGQRAGVSSFVGWLAQERLAVAVLCNVADAPAASIGHELISKLLGRDDIAWPRRKPPVEISAREALRFVGTLRLSGKIQLLGRSERGRASTDRARGQRCISSSPIATAEPLATRPSASSPTAMRRLARSRSTSESCSANKGAPRVRGACKRPCGCVRSRQNCWRRLPPGCSSPTGQSAAD